jgi:hypothetical protein
MLCVSNVRPLPLRTLKGCSPCPALQPSAAGRCLASGTVTGLAVGATYTLIVAPSGSIGSVVMSGLLTDPATATSLPLTYSSTATGCADSGTGKLNKS